MTLSTLIEKGGLSKIMTATPATIATIRPNREANVAKVATVAVAPGSESQPNPENRLTLPELSQSEESAIRTWLDHIEETDLQEISKVLEQCRANLAARSYFLGRSEEGSKPS